MTLALITGCDRERRRQVKISESGGDSQVVDEVFGRQGLTRCWAAGFDEVLDGRV